jgi:hypothetical protein
MPAYLPAALVRPALAIAIIACVASGRSPAAIWAKCPNCVRNALILRWRGL